MCVRTLVCSRSLGHLQVHGAVSIPTSFTISGSATLAWVFQVAGTVKLQIPRCSSQVALLLKMSSGMFLALLLLAPARGSYLRPPPLHLLRSYPIPNRRRFPEGYCHVLITFFILLQLCGKMYASAILNSLRFNGIYTALLSNWRINTFCSTFNVQDSIGTCQKKSGKVVGGLQWKRQGKIH